MAVATGDENPPECFGGRLSGQARELWVDQSLEHAGVYHKVPSLVKIVKAKD